jgi:hypothetical protein
VKRKLNVTAMRQVPFPITLQAAIRSRLGLPSLPGGNGSPQTGESEASDVEKPYSRSLRRNKACTTIRPKPLPSVDVVRALRRYRYDSTFRGQRRVPIRTLAAMVGLSYETLYQTIRSGRASERTRSKLSWAITAINDGRLRFSRRRQTWEPEGPAVSLF